MIYLLALVSGIFHGIGNLLQKKATNNLDKPMLSAFIFGASSSIVAIFMLLHDHYNGGIIFPNWGTEWLLVLFANIVLFSFAFWGQLRSIREIPISEQTLLSRMSVITYTLGGILFLGEKVSSTNILGLFLVLIGVIFSGIRKGKFILNKWVAIQLISSVTFGFIVLIDGIVSPSFSIGIYVFLSAFMGALVPFYISIKDGSLRALKSFPKNYLYPIALAGTFSIIAYYLTIKAYSLGGLVSITGALTQIKIVVAVVGGYIIFNERSDLFTKFLGVITVMAGLVLIKL